MVLYLVKLLLLLLWMFSMYRLVREEVGDVNILVNNAGIMVIKQVLPNIIKMIIKVL